MKYVVYEEIEYVIDVPDDYVPTDADWGELGFALPQVPPVGTPDYDEARAEAWFLRDTSKYVALDIRERSVTKAAS